MPKARTAGFKEKLREAIVASGMAVEDVAKRLGVQKTAVYDWLNGKSEPNLSAASRFVKAMQWSLDYMVNDEMKAVPGPPKLSRDREDIERMISGLGESRALKRLYGEDPKWTAGEASEIQGESTEGESQRGKRDKPGRK